MLAAHLDPNWDAALRKASFIAGSADWIAQKTPPKAHPALLDLGCGPGLYAQRFSISGYAVTGVDIASRSIAYAKKAAGFTLVDYWGDAARTPYCDTSPCFLKNKKNIKQ